MMVFLVTALRVAAMSMRMVRASTPTRTSVMSKYSAALYTAACAERATTSSGLVTPRVSRA